MTKEKIIDNIARLNSETWRDREEVRTEIGKLLAELKNALEQQPSEDCVSRQALLEFVESKYQSNWWNVDEVLAKIKALPPVTPTRCIAEVKFSKEDLREICNERIEIECTHGTCKDCKHRDPEDKKCDCGHTIQWQTPRPDDWYCADFEM